VLQVAVVYTQPQQTVLQRLNYLKTQGQQKWCEQYLIWYLVKETCYRYLL
jgi:hypothetical protein